MPQSPRQLSSWLPGPDPCVSRTMQQPHFLPQGACCSCSHARPSYYSNTSSTSRLESGNQGFGETLSNQDFSSKLKPVAQRYPTHSHPILFSLQCKRNLQLRQEIYIYTVVCQYYTTYYNSTSTKAPKYKKLTNTHCLYFVLDLNMW